MENNTNEVTRAEFITPLNEPDMPAKVAAKIEKEDKKTSKKKKQK